MHGKRLSQDARAGVNIDQRVIHGPAAGDANYVTAQVHRVVDRISVLDPGRQSRSILRGPNSSRKQHRNTNGPGDPIGPCARGTFIRQPRKPADLHHHKPHLKKHCWNPNPLICVELSLRNLFERRLTLAGRRCKLHYRMKAGLRLEPWIMVWQLMHGGRSADPALIPWTVDAATGLWHWLHS